MGGPLGGRDPVPPWPKQRRIPMRASSLALLLTGLAAVARAGPACAAPAGWSPSLAASGGLLMSVRARHHGRHHRIRRSARMPAGAQFNTVTRRAIGGDSGGTAVTGSTAVPQAARPWSASGLGIGRRAADAAGPAPRPTPEA